MTNGATFSPDGTFLYHADSLRRVIYRYDLTPQGELVSKILWMDLPGEAGYPDGMSTDEQGGIWVAHYGGGRVTRFAPEGAVERVIELPTSQITSCVFAGDGLDRLFGTSAVCDREHEPLAGGLFEFHPGVRGVAPRLFAG